MGLKQRPKYESSEDDQDAMKVDDSSDEDESLAVRAARLKENAGATERSSVAQDDSRREGAADARTKESKISDESSTTPAVKKSTAAKKAPRKASAEAKAKPKKAAGHRQAAKAKTANATAVQNESDSEDEPLTTALHKKGGILSGKTFVLSDAYGLDDADDMHEMVKQHAGRISDALSKVRLADAVVTHLFRPLHAHS